VIFVFRERQIFFCFHHVGLSPDYFDRKLVVLNIKMLGYDSGVT